LRRTERSTHVATGPRPRTINAGLHVATGISQHRFVASEVLEGGTSTESAYELLEEEGKITTTGDIDLAEVCNGSRNMNERLRVGKIANKAKH
jgi:hypothetical protein